MKAARHDARGHAAFTIPAGFRLRAPTAGDGRHAGPFAPLPWPGTRLAQRTGLAAAQREHDFRMSGAMAAATCRVAEQEHDGDEHMTSWLGKIFPEMVAPR